jgi:antitoxin component of MazEF toxin-antitoxin module
MDIRSIQKTGNMHYIYLPTSWCKKYNINSDTKVSLAANNDGSITISPQIGEAERRPVNLSLPEATPGVLIKLIMACYINPIKSFHISVEKQTDLLKILDKKAAVSALEFVELDENTITHESSIYIKDPHSLLKTMVKKIKNLIKVMLENYDKELINKYEQEIDRSKLLITKSVTGSLVLNEPTVLKTVDLHYIALLTQDLERMVDSLIFVDQKEILFLKKISKIIESILDLLEDLSTLNYTSVIELEKNVSLLKTPDIKNIAKYSQRRIKRHLSNISEVFFDWAITKEVEKGK